MSGEQIMSKIEERFDGWLKEFEERPIRTGMVIIIVVLLLRWVWKSFR